MIKRTLISLLSLTAIAAAAGPASAADSVVVPLPPATWVQDMTALDDTIVWVQGRRLMQRSPDGTIARVAGTPNATYRSVDLGRTASGATVLTYLRCDPSVPCKAYSDDLEGRHASFKRLAPGPCRVTAAPARWRAHVAYGMSCFKRNGRFDAARSGIFVRRGAGAPRRLRLPVTDEPASRFEVETVDLRGSIVAAHVTGYDGFTFEVVQTIDGSNRRSAPVAGGGDEARNFNGGISLGARGALWTLVYGFDSGDAHAVIRRLLDDGCTEEERLPATLAGDYPANAMAVDGDRVYLVTVATGIVEHEFSPFSTCN